jgi:DNA-binding transcriptional regulator YdaS (Cro superfamily)
MKTILKIAAAMMLASGTAAFAAKEVTGANSAEGSGAQSAPTGKAGAAKAKKHCLMIEASTGSRISRRECHTKAEWEELGYDLKDAR